MHPQPSFLLISDDNAVVAHVRLLGRFARNRPVRRDTKPPLNRRRLTTDPQLRDEVATTVAARLQALPSRDTSVDARETAFATATLQAAAALVPQQKRTTPGRCCCCCLLFTHIQHIVRTYDSRQSCLWSAEEGDQMKIIMRHTHKNTKPLPAKLTRSTF